MSSVSFNKTWKQLTLLNDRLSCVTYTIAEQWGKLTGQPRGLVLMLHNQLYKLVMKYQDTLLIWETTASQNCEHRDLQTLGLYCIGVNMGDHSKSKLWTLRFTDFGPALSFQCQAPNCKLYICMWLLFLFNHWWAFRSVMPDFRLLLQCTCPHCSGIIM